MDVRELKALELAAKARIVFVNGAWIVPSQASPGTTYRATIGGGASCTREDWSLRRQDCKHVLAAKIVAARDGKGKAPEIVTDAVPKRPAFAQNWPAYNEAQRTEKHRLQILLADLCSGITDPPRSCCGRKPVPLADRPFATIFKVYSTFSSRRFNCDLQDAHERGHLSRPLRCNEVNSFLEGAELTPLLKALIVRSAMPLRAVDTDFAVDSSGFSASKFVRWYDEKYGQERSGHDWVNNG